MRSSLHETGREGCRQTSTSVVQLQLTVREGLCWGLSSGPEGRTEKRRNRDENFDTGRVLLPLLKREESLDKVLVLLLELLVRRGLGEIWRNHDTASSILRFTLRFGGKRLLCFSVIKRSFGHQQTQSTCFSVIKRSIKT